MVLASKFGKHPALWMTDDPTGGATVYTPAMIEEALHTSLASLQTDVIDLYQVHWPGNIGLKGGPEDWKVARVCIETLEKAKSDGWIRHWGVCNFGTEDLVALDKAGGGAAAVSNQLPYNLLWRAIEHGILPACESRGMAVLAYSPLQQGLLSGKYTSPTQLEPGRCGRHHLIQFRRRSLFVLVSAGWCSSQRRVSILPRLTQDSNKKKTFACVENLQAPHANFQAGSCARVASWEPRLRGGGLWRRRTVETAGGPRGGRSLLAGAETEEGNQPFLSGDAAMFLL
eukprot:COSAG06_NODE_3197_length_5701_cov_5.984470_6_plen_285_part_00